MSVYKSVSTLKRTGFVYLTKHHYYSRGRLKFSLKTTKQRNTNDTLTVYMNIYKKEIYDKLTSKMNCSEKEFRAFRAITTKLNLNGSETFE